MSTITVTIPGHTMPLHYSTRVIHSDESRPQRYSELTGPQEDFAFTTGMNHDKVLVVRPELVEIKTFKKAL